MAYTDAQIMMTLASLANISTAPRPSGEGLRVQQGRIKHGINGMLHPPLGKNLATASGKWQAVWVGLSQSAGEDANLSYIATDDLTPPKVAVVVRGTTDSLEFLEDLDCGPSWGTFSPSPSGPYSGPYNVSPGFLEAFNNITAETTTDQLTTATSLGQINLLAALQALVKAGTTTIYVTGHSLGGAVATMMALYLQSQFPQSQFPNLSINLYTFAAPTAGDSKSGDGSGFAEAVEDLKTTLLPNGPKCYVNQYDAVPCAYLTSGQPQQPQPINLNNLGDLYNGKAGIPAISPLPADMTGEELLLLTYVRSQLPVNQQEKGPPYAQPHQQTALNTGNPPLSSPAPCAGLSWIMEMAFQHENNTYLALLGLSKELVNVPSPAITSVTFNSSAPPITIIGSYFDNSNNQLAVDIGIYQPATSVSANSAGTSITCTPASGQTITASTTFAVCVATENGSCAYTYWGQAASQSGNKAPGSNPQITSVSVSGSAITITGYNLSNPNNSPPGVYIGIYQPATSVSANSAGTSITCTPASGQSISASTAFAVCVTTEYGSFTRTYPAPSVKLKSKLVGQAATITATAQGQGEEYVQNSNIQWGVVDLGATLAPNNSQTATSMTATVPAACAGTSANVTVSNPAAGGTSLPAMNINFPSSSS